MDAKEKALELFEKYQKYLIDNGTIKTCALTAVDEIIKSWKEDGGRRLDGGIIHYWQKVKEEIEKLK